MMRCGLLVVLLAGCACPQEKPAAAPRPVAEVPDAGPPVVEPPKPEPPKEEREVWAGTLVLPTELRDFVVTFTRTGDAPWAATIDVPAVGARGVALKQVAHGDAALVFEVGNEVYSFTRDAGAAEATGTVVIGGAQRFTGRMVRLGAGEAPRTVIARPQTPQPPYPYAEREVTIAAPEGGQLAGTLTVPEGAGPFPAVLLISGSGQQDRDETIFGHRPFRVIADRLTRDGFAVLRTDDRGTGKTTGAVGSLDTDIGDGRAAFEFLAAQPEVDKKRVGIIGHSVGGLIAPTVAARTGKVAFVVALAGPGVPGWELVAVQLEALLLASGTPAADAARLGAAQRAVSKAVVAGKPDGVKAALRAALLENIKVAGQPEPPAAELDALVAAQLPALQNPWVVTFYKTDPAPTWRKVKVPVLVLIGEKDLQVPADLNLARIGAALKQAGNKDVTLTKLPGLNHLYQHAATGVIDEYGTIEETFDPATLDTLAAWLAARAKKR
jgi:dienelactone hydrolase